MVLKLGLAFTPIPHHQRVSVSPTDRMVLKQKDIAGTGKQDVSFSIPYGSNGVEAIKSNPSPSMSSCFSIPYGSNGVEAQYPAQDARRQCLFQYPLRG